MKRIECLLLLLVLLAPLRVYAQSAPTVQVLYPSGMVSSDSQTITAIPSTLTNLNSVDLYVNGSYVERQTASPFVFTRSNQGENVYQVFVIANYSSSIEVQSAIATYSVGAPSRVLALTNAKNKSPGSFLLTCTPYVGSPGAISSVEFYINGNWQETDRTAPYTHEASGLKANSYQAEAIVNYSNGNEFSTNIVGLSVGLPKAIVKARGTGRRDQRIIKAKVGIRPSNPGDVSSVNFYLNGQYVGNDSTAPYSYRLTGLSGGRYRVTAEVNMRNGDEITKSSKPIRFGKR